MTSLAHGHPVARRPYWTARARQKQGELSPIACPGGTGRRSYNVKRARSLWDVPFFFVSIDVSCIGESRSNSQEYLSPIQPEKQQPGDQQSRSPMQKRLVNLAEKRKGSCSQIDSKVVVNEIVEQMVAAVGGN